MTLVLFLSAKERVVQHPSGARCLPLQKSGWIWDKGQTVKKKYIEGRGREGLSNWEHLHSIWHLWAGSYSEVRIIINEIRKGEQNNKLREESV